MTFWYAVAVLVGGLAALYAGAWVTSRAYFDNKLEHHKKLLRQLEEKTRC